MTTHAYAQRLTALTDADLASEAETLCYLTKRGGGSARDRDADYAKALACRNELVRRGLLTEWQRAKERAMVKWREERRPAGAKG